MTERCHDFDVLIARRDQLTIEEAVSLDAHLVGCDACRDLARAVKPVDDEAAFVETGIAAGVAETMMTTTPDHRGPVRDLSEDRADRYRITGEVGRGGLGRVLRALDRVLDRPVALKELFSASAAMRSRFVREALITARLQHPSIVPVYDAGHLGDRSPFYAMKLVAGRPLDKAIAEATTLAQRLALVPTVLAVADAIAYAHNEKIIHRDLKPTNILVGKYGETIVIDWGLAKDLATEDRDALEAGPYRDAAGDQTIVGTMMGTPAYMAPEQAIGGTVDERTDVYALGAILYQIMSGAIPHEGDTLEDMVTRVIAGEVRPLTDREPGVPRDLAAIVTKAMALDPDERYENAQGFADDLRRFSTGQLVASHTYRIRDLVRRWIAQHRGVVAVTAAALLVLGVVATLSIRNILVARGEANASREEARLRLAGSYVDRAGNELVHAQPARSLAYTIASAQVTGLTPQTRLMAARALDQLPPLRWWSDPKVNAMFAPGSHDLLINTNATTVRWNPDTDRAQWRVPVTHGGLMLLGRDTLAVAKDNTVALIAVADGAPVAELAGATGASYTGRLGTDAANHWLAAAARDRIDLFDLKTRAFVASIPTTTPGIYRVSSDGEHVLVQGASQLMSILDRSGATVATFKAQISNVLFAGDELIYATPSLENRITDLRVADWAGKVRLDLAIGSSPINALEVDVATKRVALGSEDGVVQVRSLESGDVLWQTTLGDRAGAIVFDGDVFRVATSSTVVSFDVASGLELERASVPGTAALLASDDHARVAGVVFGSGLAVWASPRGELVSLRPTPASVSDVVLAPNGTAITAGQDGEIHELRDGRSVRRLASGAAINTLSRLDDGTLITANTMSTIIVRDREGLELRRFFGGMLAAPAPDGRRIAAATLDGTVAIFDTATGTSQRVLGKVGAVNALRWSPDGRLIAALAKNGVVSVWNASGLVRTIPVGNFLPAAIAFSNDGKWLVRSGEPADTLFALDGGPDRKLLAAGRQGAALVVAFSPDNKTVLVAGLGFLSTWDIASATPRLRIATDGFVTAAAFFAGGANIIAGGPDRRMHVWNADTGAELLSFTVPAQPLKLVVDVDRIAILVDHGVAVWTIPTFAGSLADLRERARCRLDLAVVDAHLRPQPIDVTTCNRAPW